MTICIFFLCLQSFCRDYSFRTKNTKEKSVRRIILNGCTLCFVVLFLSGGQRIYGQLVEKLLTTDCAIDTFRKGQLSVEVDNLSFFANNEFNSTVQKGYTLPGFWLQLKGSYYPLSNLKLEAGVHSIWFWGTTKYPAFAYKGMTTWGGKDYSHNVHVLPYYRAHLALSENVSVVLGNLYGGSNHRLIEPLYNPELDFSSDPEHGLQFLYKTKWLHLDSWIDWMTYIYNLDTHQESFVAGASARFRVNDPKSRWHVYFPMQGLAQHTGGEIEAIDEDIQTIMNGAVGAGLTWNLNNPVLKSINLEVDAVGYTCQKGAYPLKNGRGFFAKYAMQLSDFNLHVSYWEGKNFIPIYGSPFYGSVSTKLQDGIMLYQDPKMLHLGIDYVRPLGKGFSFGIYADVYYYLSGKMYSAETGLYQPRTFGNNSNFSLGVCLRINPSFLIKQY